LVNAVLRRLTKARNGGDMTVYNAGGLDPIKRLSLETSHPMWMLNRWIRRYGLDKTKIRCLWNNQRAPLTLRVNRRRARRGEVISLMSKAGLEARPGRYCPDALVVHGFSGAPTTLPGWNDSLLLVQDEAAQLVTLLLDPTPNERILDLCAGAGGKTIHIADIISDVGLIHAFDPNKKRLARLVEVRDRLELKSIEIVQTKQGLLKNYDRILIDAPCSGFGVIRRRPDIKWNRTEALIQILSRTQLELLKEASERVRPGGRLVYAVCTTEPDETTGVIEAFLKTRPDFRLITCRNCLPDRAKMLADKAGFLEIKPKEDGPDLFFAAVLEAPC
ncbi:MAG: RsmB/NOP family class I SAM-dependent RNA methyltransferase, partial [Dissulfurimicrobium sp.]